MSKNQDKIRALTVTLLALLVTEMGGAEAPEATETETEPQEEPKEKKGGKKEEKAEEPEEPKGPTLAELREQAQALMADGKAEDIKKVLKKHGSESLTKLDAKNYGKVKAAFDALAVE